MEIKQTWMSWYRAGMYQYGVPCDHMNFCLDWSFLAQYDD